jgi:hypothetical protein
MEGEQKGSVPHPASQQTQMNCEDPASPEGYQDPPLPEASHLRSEN